MLWQLGIRLSHKVIQVTVTLYPATHIIIYLVQMRNFSNDYKKYQTLMK